MMSMMDQKQPNFEAVPAVPETGVETPDTGAAFEAPAPQEQAAESAPTQSSGTVAATNAYPAASKDETTVNVERVMEEGLGQTYSKLSEKDKIRFKQEGERVVREVSGMIRSLKVQADRVLKLIRKWLSIIPGVNKWFMAQEAKIKTDRLVALGEEERKKRETAV